MTLLAQGYRLRAATAADFAQLNHIEQAAARIFPPGFLPAGVLTDKLPFGVLEQARQQNGLWVIQHTDGTPVGYVVLECIGALTLLAQIDVHPAHGRKGLGAALVNHALAQAQARGVSEVWLTTFSNVPWNAPFYQKLGFCLVDEDSAPEAIRDILRKERACGLEHRVVMQYRFKVEP